MTNCRKFRLLIDLYLDGEAEESDERILFSHIEDCDGCRNRFEEVRKLQLAIESVPDVQLPDGFRGAVLRRIQSEAGRRHWAIRPFPAIAGCAAVVFLVMAVLWYIHTPEPAIPEIHIVSPREDAVIEEQYVDISAAFSLNQIPLNEAANSRVAEYEEKEGKYFIRVILDTRDVTHATEISDGFLIYASDALQGGYHIAVVQIVDKEGAPITQRSWPFYVIQSDLAKLENDSSRQI